MEYQFLDNSLEKDNIILPNSDKINPFLSRNNYADIIKAVDFIASEEKFLHVHGFMGTGKRQFINYVSEFLNKDVIKLEYYCKEATVCDDILLYFTDILESNALSKAVNINTKITTLNVKFKQLVSSIKKPFLIILHSLDDVQEGNETLIKECFSSVAKEENVKIIVSTRAMQLGALGELEENRKIFLKAFTKEIFKEFLTSNGISAAEKTLEDFYKYTRGYYYYVALTVKIIQAMQIELHEFLQKFAQSGMSFDSYLGVTYINLVPTAIRNFFWFLRTIRHGLTINALALFEIYDEFSLEYLKNNLMIFQSAETIYVQDYFLQKIDISIPKKTQIKLHKYIIGIYEKQLKEPLKQRAFVISRQALRAEIEYHNQCIEDLENSEDDFDPDSLAAQENAEKSTQEVEISDDLAKILEKALAFEAEKKYTDAIEAFSKILETEGIDLSTLVEVRLHLAKLYKQIGEYRLASHYYELVETYYKQHKEFINLNYLYYDMTDLYYKMYKNERAIETIKKTIYSVDTPQSLMVSACTLLGNIYADMDNSDEAYSYYKKALDSLDENVDPGVLAELYFKYALACDDKGDMDTAYEYYNKSVSFVGNNSYKALAYSNLASCYKENNNYDEALNCFTQAYNIEKNNNNYDGIYYTALNIAKIFVELSSDKALSFLFEAKSSAEFLNETFYMMEASIALGDFYYNKPKHYPDALKEYFKARNLANSLSGEVDVNKISRRIEDMKLRMEPEAYEIIEKKYEK